MSTLLLEIGCEELPAAFCRWAEGELRDRWLPAFGGEGKVLVGPRRLALLVEGFEPDAAGEEKRGPGVGIAFKGDKPTKAAEGFARGLGLGVDELTVRDDYVWGRQSAPPLGERLWQVVGGLAAGKTMTWNRELDLRFPRPIRWICAKLDAETIEVGPEAIPSGSVSHGHRFGAGTVEIPEASAYETVLREAQVEPDSAERRRLIVEGLDATGEWRDPAGVLEEVVYLVESPLVLEGSFDERFLDLPERVIVTAMQSHQRYFPLGGARFAFVANGGDPGVVRTGNERVLGGTPGRCAVLLRAGRPGWDRSHGRAARLDHVPSRGQARSPTRPSGSVSSATSWGAAMPPEKPHVWPRPTRPRRWCTSFRS